MADRQIALLLDECARLTADPEVLIEDAERPLSAAVALLKQAEATAGVPEALAPENYLLCAEAALGVDNVPLAHQCAERFLRSRPPKSQFLVRAYYALGRVQAAYSYGLKAKELLDSTMAALSQLHHGITMAAELGPAHRFLVYNGSVHLWNVARPLMALPSTSAELVPLLDTTIKALVATQEKDEKKDESWQLQLNMALARCKEAAGKKKEAGDLLDSKEVSELAKERLEQEQLLQLLLHMRGDDAAAVKKLRDDSASKPRNKGLLTAQLLRDGGAVADPQAELADAVAAVDPELAAALKTEGDQAAIAAAVSTLKGATDDADVLMALATQAATRGLLDLANHCANRCATAKSLACRVRAGYVREMVKIGRLDDGTAGPPQSEVYTRLMVGTRVDSLKRLEEQLASARRTADPELISDGCSLVWNIAKPLLQPALYHHAMRSLQLAASALEDIGSPMHELRVCLHLELARAEAEAEFVKKAAEHVEKALALDVPLDARGERPLDTPLLQMKQKLALKTDIYREAESAEEKAMLLLEQVRMAKQPRLQQRLAGQMLTMMQESEPPPPPTGEEGEAAPAAEGDEASDEAAAAAKAAKAVRVERTHLWAGLMRAAWSQRMVPVARAAAGALLAYSFVPEGSEKELVRIQADARYVQGETLVAEMQMEIGKAETYASGEATQPNGRPEPPEAAAEKAAKATAAAAELRQGALREFEAGIALGRSLAEDVVVHNGCTYVWNYSLGALRAMEYPPLLSALQVCVEALQACDQAALKADVQLLKLACNLAAALATGLELGATSDPEPPSKRRALDTKNADAAGAVKSADAVCKWACELATGRPRIKKAATACWARLQAYGGAKEPNVGVEPEANAYGLLELLAVELLDAGAASAALAKAKELLRGGGSGGEGARPEPELWVKTAQQALVLGDLASVVEACESALAPLRALAKGTTVLKEEWRWYSLAECVHGEAIQQLLKPDQQLQLQLQLHAQALDHLAQSMAYANKAELGSLVVSAAERFWRHCTPLAESTSKAKLRSPVGIALDELQKLPEELQPSVVDMRVRLYEVMLAVLTDAAEWAAGLALLKSAFASLPSSAHQTLWEQKVTFMCRGGGKGLMGEMFRLKDFPAETQARVWSVMGANADGRGEQLTANMRAVEALNNAPPLQKVDYLITLAEWLYCNDFPLRDAQDQLMAAIDILMDCEEETPDDDGEGADDGASVCSQSDAGSASRAGSQRGGTSSRGGTSVASSTTGSRASGKGGDKTTPDVELQVMHFEQLARIYAMLARMAPSAEARVDNCLIAHHYLTRMWAQSVGAANAAEAAAPPPAAPAGLEPLADGEAGGPPYALPAELHEWVGWAPSERLRKLMAASGSLRMIQPATVPKPHLSCFYLRYCAETLARAGMALHALLPLSLLRVVAADVLKEPAMERLATLQTAQLLHQLGAAAPAAALRAQLGRLMPTAEQHQLNQVQLRQLQEAAAAAAANKPAKAPAAAPAAAAAAATGAVAPPKRLGRKEASRSAEALWVETAALLLDEGEWAAAQAWLLEAAPLLEARADADYVARCSLLLARVAALQGDVERALSLQLTAMATPLEVEEWAAAVVALAEYHAAAGDERKRMDTLAKAIDVCGEAAAANPNSAIDVLAAQAALQQALARGWRDAALLMKAGALPYAEEAGKAGALLHAAAETLQSVGAHEALATVLLARAELVEALPQQPPPQPPDGEEIELLLEAEAEQLQLQLEPLSGALAAAGRVLAAAAPRTMPLELSLPAARRLADVKARLALLELRLAAHKAHVEATVAPPLLAYPTVEGRDDAAVAAFMVPPKVAPPATHMTHEERALMHASSAVALAGKTTVRARALLASGMSLIAIASAKGWGKGAWAPPPPPPAADAPPAAEGEGEGDAPPEPPPPGTDEATRGEAQLKEAAQLALAEIDTPTVQQAALALAGAAGAARAAEATRWLCLAQACGARRHWLGVWRQACGASDRFALLAKLVEGIQAQWTQPTELAAVKGALAILGSDGGAGCATWRSLETPLDPLEAMLPKLEPTTRVLLLTCGDDGTSLHGCVFGSSVEPAAAKGEAPTVTLSSAVSRASLPAGALHELGAAAEAMRALQSKAALTRAKDALQRAAPGGGSAPPPESTEPGAEELALHGLVVRMADALKPLLAPLLPLLGPEAPGGANLAVAVVADPQLACLPLELLPALRESHIAVACRDLSVGVMAQRLLREPPPCKKSGWGYAVDPRNEVELPLDEKQKGNKKDAAAAAADGGAKTAQSLCDAFEADVLTGGRVAFGKEWGKAGSGSGLLGASQVPSAVDWQRCLLKNAGFAYLGPGPLLAQVAPASLAPLKLHGCAAALMLDRIESDASSRRLAKEDNKKDAARLALEQSHTTAALLSLAGVRSVLINQWGSTAAESRETLDATLEKLGGGGSLGDALRGARAGLVVVDESRPTTTGSKTGSKTSTPRGTKTSKPATPKGRPGSGADAKGKGAKGKGKKGAAPEPVAEKPIVWGVLANAVLYGAPSLKLS